MGGGSRRALSRILLTTLVVTLAVPPAETPPASAAATNPSIVPIVPVRLLDTRVGTGAPAAKVGAGGVVELTVTGGVGGVPVDAVAVALNVTATEASADGFVTVWACGSARPLAANLNVSAGGTIPNLVIARIGTNGKVCLFSQSGTHLVADLNAFWVAPAAIGEPNTSTGVVVAQSGAGQPTGAASATGDPVASAGITFSPEAAAATERELPPPTQEEARTALGGDLASTLMPLFDSRRAPIRTEMLTNEQPYPIGTSGYVNSVDTAVGRVVLWTYINGTWKRASSCSGTVVGADLVLTAAHCLQRKVGTGYVGYDAFSFIPALYGSSSPKGEWFAGGTRAWAHDLYFSLRNQGRPESYVLDYGFIKFDPSENGGYSLSATTGGFQIAMETNLVGRDLYTVGYPVEGFFALANKGWCDLTSPWCFPYHCSSKGAQNANFNNGWRMIGYGCNMNGGMSGAAVFSQIGSTWYVVSVNDYGGWNADRSNAVCPPENRSACSWYMVNGWGPEFRKGWLDTLWQFASTA